MTGSPQCIISIAFFATFYPLVCSVMDWMHAWIVWERLLLQASCFWSHKLDEYYKTYLNSSVLVYFHYSMHHSYCCNSISLWKCNNCTLMPVSYSLCITARKQVWESFKLQHITPVPYLSFHATQLQRQPLGLSLQHTIVSNIVTSTCVFSRLGARRAPVILETQNMVWVNRNCVLSSASWQMIRSFKFYIQSTVQIRGRYTKKSRIIYFIHEDRLCLQQRQSSGSRERDNIRG
jgi:hypothetical protein